jgi:hypothetical protein
MSAKAPNSSVLKKEPLEVIEVPEKKIISVDDVKPCKLINSDSREEEIENIAIDDDGEDSEDKDTMDISMSDELPQNNQL